MWTGTYGLEYPKEAVMDNLYDYEISMHQEFIRREASIHLALKQSGLVKPPLLNRALPVLGDALIRLGNHLKQYSYRQPTSEEATVPTFLIML
jgi:hypothetical protein